MNEKDKERLRVVIEQVFIGWDIGSGFPDEPGAKGQILDLIDRQPTEEMARKLVDDLYDGMNNLHSPKEEWDVHPAEFLPANVVCDFSGQARFKKLLLGIVRKGLGVEEVER